MSLTFQLSSTAPETAATPCLVVGMHEDGSLGAAAERVDAASGGAIRRLHRSGDATGKAGATATLFGLAGVAAPIIVPRTTRRVRCATCRSTARCPR